MARTFVAINDPLHALVRSITRQTLLRPRSDADGGVTVQYEVTPELLPVQYFDLASRRLFGPWPRRQIRLGNWLRSAAEKRWLPVRTDYFDIVRLDWRCARDLRLKLQKHGPGMLAAELLTFGTGVLRACNDDSEDALQRNLRQQHGWLQTPHQQVYARIRALPWSALPLFSCQGKESFDSTNIIYGDSYGELEQLWERRADTAFLDLVAASLQPLRHRGELADHLCPPLNAEAVMKMHLRAQVFWRVPPANGRALLRRIEYVLDRTTVDETPRTMLTSSDEPARPGGSSWAGAAREWGGDQSGYDGWLAGGEAGAEEL